MNLLSIGAVKSYIASKRWLHLVLLWLDSLVGLLSQKKI